MHSLRQRAHCLLKRRVRVKAVRIEYIYIIQPHPGQRLIEAGQQILAATPLAIGARPHIIASFCGNDHLVAIGCQILCQYLAKCRLSTAMRRTIIIRQIKMCDAGIKGGQAHVTLGFVRGGLPKIVPQAE